VPTKTRSDDYKVKHREHDRQKYKEKMEKKGKKVNSDKTRDSLPKSNALRAKEYRVR
jgi:hypothetical protein